MMQLSAIGASYKLHVPHGYKLARRASFTRSQSYLLLVFRSYSTINAVHESLSFRFRCMYSRFEEEGRSRFEEEGRSSRVGKEVSRFSLLFELD
jgi:hypothetical protein